MSFHVGDSVRVNKDINRAEGPYAQEGEKGTILEIFRPQATGFGEKKPLCAKVRILRKKRATTLTLRLSSIERTNAPEKTKTAK